MAEGSCEPHSSHTVLSPPAPWRRTRQSKATMAATPTTTTTKPAEREIEVTLK